MSGSASSSGRERERQDRSHLQHAAEHTRPRRSSSALRYLVLLFAAAFLLLLLSYFMQRRQNEKATSDALKQSVSAVDTIQKLTADNDGLRQQIAQLQQQLLDRDRALSDQQAASLARLEAEEETSAQLTRQLEAMDWFWRIQREASRGQYGAARRLIAAFEATGLPASLPDTGPADPEGRTPAQQYAAVVAFLS